MERHHQEIGAFDHGQPETLSGDELAIQLGIEAARVEEREVTDAVARAIATQLHDGQGSALYRLASTGSLEHERLHAELHELLYQSQSARILEWASVLGTYALHREQRGPVDGWHELWPDRPGQTPQPAATDPEAEARRALFDRINAAGVTMLGQVATIHTAEGVHGVGADEHDDPAEPDTYPWTDAVRWRPDGDGPDDLASTEGVSSELVDELFDRLPDAEFGSHEEMGWGGLLRHEGRSGGAILHQNHYGRRSAWTTDSDDELAARWRQLQEEHEAYRSATQSPETQGSGDSPKVWVGSLADYTAGHLHGAWLDASLEPDELVKAVQFVLRNSHEPDAEEYGIFDYDGFGEAAGLLGEYPSLKTVSKIAQGIAEHGQAFAAWAAYVGPEQAEQLDRFEDHYFGEYDSMEAYAENLLEESEAYWVVDEAPEWLRPYLKIDVEMYAQDLGYDLHVVEKPDGGVWVFDTRM